MRILIVEDDPAGLLLLKRYLEPLSQVDTTVDGSDAIELFRRGLEENKPYDLVCLDIMLPSISGHETLMEIRLEESKKGIMGLDRCKVLMITALNDPTQIIESFKEQCDGYLPKPLFYNKLVEELKKLKINLESP